ncbi:glycoside hydrolase family 27 protein [Pedobacter sp. UBA5917]|jgi:alpha-galactosidase|uniref:glycoside hydrolase family 27 protein n=1 Tax=Pedobacter sp. UBA5917 TaxID=1947061 RepID=UPI0025F6CCFF|nr:glycoside hydrolase family 27 protein [Pedobacter sp. UBA5917]
MVVCAGNTASAQQFDTIKNGLSLSPVMGWSSWNTFKKNPTEQVIREIADAMVASGLKDAGYQYVNVDDFWSPGRDSNGKIIVDSVKFPSGMKALADYIHSKGLKAGIYTNIGEKANYETLASGGFYESDMQQFADWGYDFVKVDVNFAPVRTAEAYSKEFEAVAKAILKTGRPMVFSICNQGGREYWTWAPKLGNSWRVGPDIDHTPKQKSQWEGVMYELGLSAAHPDIAGPGHWNDADMMLVGVGDDGGRLTVMNDEESKSHFSLWCMIASPLMLGNDLRSMHKGTLDILKNTELIAINQDVLGYQGRIAYEVSSGLEVWQKKIKQDGISKTAICMLNRTDKTEKITLDLDKIGIKGRHKLRDLWLHKDLGKVNRIYKRLVPSHGVAMLFIE